MSKLPESVCFYCADQNPPRDRSRGITHYTAGLLSHLRDSNSVALKAVVSKSSFAIPSDIERIALPFRTDHLPGRLIGDHLHPMITGRTAGVWHYPKGFLPLGPQVKAKRVGTVADVMLQFDADHHPESRSKLAWTYWLGVLKHSIRNLDLIITVSEFSKRAICEFCDRYGLNCPPIVVTYQGVEVSSARAEKQNYVLHLASPLPYKATRWLLEQWLALQKIDDHMPPLKLVGALDEKAAGIFAQIRNASIVPPLPRKDLEESMARARALLLPSEIEGFGIPAVEAYLLGTPVAYAKNTALEEVVGFGSPGGFDRDSDSFKTALDQTLSMDGSEIEKKAVELNLRYNWKDCVARTLQAYATVMERDEAH
jgi:glycosyltransferase involved in cell wall biosynthesis